jgi:hypothetical protein
MTAARVALVAAVGALACWAAKSVAIGIGGGLGESPLEDPLFLAGAGCALVGVVALGVAWTAGRSWLVRGLGVALGVLGFGVVGGAIAVVVELLTPDDHWVWGEINLWLSALVLLVVARTTARTVARRGARAPAW